MMGIATIDGNRVLVTRRQVSYHTKDARYDFLRPCRLADPKRPLPSPARAFLLAQGVAIDKAANGYFVVKIADLENATRTSLSS